MAELPEFTILEKQMNESLSGRTVKLVEALQEKNLNIPIDTFVRSVTGRRIEKVTRRGKWLFIHLDEDKFVLLNVGMGADLFHYSPGAELPVKYHLRMEFDDNSGFTCRFWWLGYIRFLTADELPGHKDTAKLGPSPMEITTEEFLAIAASYPKKNVKSLILDQDKLSGIGNAYAHDILWKAKLHPQRKLGTLSVEELKRYHKAIKDIVMRAIELTGLEPDFYGKGGNMKTFEQLFIMGYKEGKPCPECGTTIQKIKTGSTQTFICPKCQMQE
jgi:formamidopyrimidine-DNA glycosylase